MLFFFFNPTLISTSTLFYYYFLHRLSRYKKPTLIMFSSAVRLAASRVAPRAARCTTAFVTRPQPVVFTLRHFSSPPVRSH